MDFYEALYTQSQATFNTYVTSGVLLQNYAHVFDLLIRLRQAVDHPYLVVYSQTAQTNAAGAAAVAASRIFDADMDGEPDALAAIEAPLSVPLPALVNDETPAETPTRKRAASRQPSVASLNGAQRSEAELPAATDTAPQPADLPPPNSRYGRAAAAASAAVRAGGAGLSGKAAAPLTSAAPKSTRSRASAAKASETETGLAARADSQPLEAAKPEVASKPSRAGSASRAGPGLPGRAASSVVVTVCGICHDEVDVGVWAACGHAFCRACVLEYVSNCEDGQVGGTKCPACSQPLTVDLSAASPLEASPGSQPSSGGGAAGGAAGGKQRAAPGTAAGGASGRGPRKGSILSRIPLDAFQSSTKIEALREELWRMQERDPSAKALVFSQFTSMLDLCHHRLEQVGLRCVRLEGHMSLDVRVFLMSLKAGGVALNLTAASHVMLMDPWWNPATEAQAMDRIHRLGQYKPITVVRFVIAGTIEERILKLQEKKQLVFEGTVGRDTAALARLTEDDLRFLFS
ncbi:hypothetical protein QJQ45_003725 [Haematococcus lacustris]|nr:hypothetical protein QJQ45_003725 [Haematococcus lacustris]